MSGKNLPEKSPLWGVRGRVRVSLGIGLGLWSGGPFFRGYFFLERFLPVAFEEIKCVLTECTTQKFTKKNTVYASELILTPFSPFDITCKKLNAKNLYVGGWVLLQKLIHTLCGALSDRKTSNGWKLLLAVATESFDFNPTGLLNPALKCIDKFRLRQ